MSLPENYKDLIVKKLGEKNTNSNCEICNSNTWIIVDQPVAAPITDLSGNVRIPQPYIPCASLICQNCGNMRLFALGALGIDVNKDI